MPAIMGILNITPDSFSDGGRYLARDAAVFRAREMVAQGAQYIDIGGESSRPGAQPVSIQEELDRVIPVLETLRGEVDATISIDTNKLAVMKAAVAAGASFINDVNGLSDPEARVFVSQERLPVCIMHRKGVSETMQKKPEYAQPVIEEIRSFFETRVRDCIAAGIAREAIFLDPGIGFGKTLDHNLSILRELAQLKEMGFPILLGVSRKQFIGTILQKPVEERCVGGLAVALWAVLQGVSVIRTHDVKETAEVFQILEVIQGLA
ncbi:MAG: dihydropteroate synthase [Legionellaceae bacterium]|nr:dihydropteroate synthase [Legionellaceae bacterium]